MIVVDNSLTSGNNKYKFINPGAKNKIITLILALKLYELNDKNKSFIVLSSNCSLPV